MAWCFSTRASVATVLTTHPCVSRCLRVNNRCFYYSAKDRKQRKGGNWLGNPHTRWIRNYKRTNLPSIKREVKSILAAMSQTVSMHTVKWKDGTRYGNFTLTIDMHWIFWPTVNISAWLAKYLAASNEKVYSYAYADYITLLRAASAGTFDGLISAKLQYLQCVSNGDTAVLC